MDMREYAIAALVCIVADLGNLREVKHPRKSVIQKVINVCYLIISLLPVRRRGPLGSKALT